MDYKKLYILLYIVYKTIIFVKSLRMYNKNCGKKMFGEKMYPAPRGNLMNPVVSKNMGGKMTEVMLKWVPAPEQKLKRKEGTYAKTNTKAPQYR